MFLGDPFQRGLAQRKIGKVSERVAIGFDNFLKGLQFVLIAFSQLNNFTQRLNIIAIRLRLGVNILDVIRDRLLFLRESFNAFDEARELGG